MWKILLKIDQLGPYHVSIDCFVKKIMFCLPTEKEIYIHVVEA